MALITCSECGNHVSGTAKVCPQCGAKGKTLFGKQPRKMGIIAKGILGFLALGVVGSTISNMVNPPAPITPEQEVAKTKARDRDVNIVTYARSLKASLRNPELLVIESALANNDATLVCFKYRSQNGFGGMNREWIAFTPAGGGQDPKVVRTICRDKDMNDVTERTIHLMKVLG